MNKIKMIEKLKKLPFISLKETQDLDNTELLFVESDSVYTKTISCGTLGIEKEDIIEYIEMQFINIINEKLTYGHKLNNNYSGDIEFDI